MGYTRSEGVKSDLAADIRYADSKAERRGVIRYVEPRGIGLRCIYVLPWLSLAAGAFRLLARRRVYLAQYVRRYERGELDAHGLFDASGLATPALLALCDAEALPE